MTCVLVLQKNYNVTNALKGKNPDGTIVMLQCIQNDPFTVHLMQNDLKAENNDKRVWHEMDINILTLGNFIFSN